MEREITEIWQAAFLMVRGFPLKQSPVGPAGFTTFIFDNPRGDIDRAVQAYINGAEVSARDFVQTYRNLKSLTMNGRRQGNGNGNRHY